MVRVARDREQLRTAGMSLLGALGAGLIIVAAWAYLREPPPADAPRRGLVDYPVLWVCSRNPGHRFEASGRFEPMPCRECGAPCYIQLRFVCPTHRLEFDVAVQFERVSSSAGDAPGERIAKYRHLDRGEWLPSDGRVPCPVPGCNALTHRPHTAWSERTTRDSRSGASATPAGATTRTDP